jgi:hypothetical protein
LFSWRTIRCRRGTSAPPSMARVIPDQPSRIPGPVPRLARTRQAGHPAGLGAGRRAFASPTTACRSAAASVGRFSE